MSKIINLPRYLIDAMTDVIRRDERGERVTEGEREWISAELATFPEYNEWLAADLLDKALRKKALV
jgi:hypothetical protein